MKKKDMTIMQNVLTNYKESILYGNARHAENDQYVEYHDTIIIGAGAAGLCFGAGAPVGKDILILEKTDKIGTKLLMSGSGQCNVTHGGSIKKFLLCYGKNGPSIRSILYRHSNMELCKLLESLGIPLLEREDGKIFPKSMNSHDVRNSLLSACKDNGVQIRVNWPVTEIKSLKQGFEVTARTGSTYNRTSNCSSEKKSLTCRNLVVACGGCSYPSTGSDGSLFPILARNLGIKIEKPKPSLVPVFLQNYPFSDLSGISLHNVGIKILKPGAPSSKIKDKNAINSNGCGDLIFTHKNLSGPVILNNSRYMETGFTLEINYVFPRAKEDIISHMKKISSGNNRQTSTFFADEYNLPRRFVLKIMELAGIQDKKLSSLSGSEITALAQGFACASYSISGLGGFNNAMATKGGVSLENVNLQTLESTVCKGLYFIGEALDIDGDTGGYNIQFAYSSANAVIDHLFGKK